MATLCCRCLGLALGIATQRLSALLGEPRVVFGVAPLDVAQPLLVTRGVRRRRGIALARLLPAPLEIGLALGAPLALDLRLARPLRVPRVTLRLRIPMLVDPFLPAFARLVAAALLHPLLVVPRVCIGRPGTVVRARLPFAQLDTEFSVRHN